MWQVKNKLSGDVGFKTGNSSYAEEEYKRETLKKELKKFKERKLK